MTGTGCPAAPVPGPGPTGDTLHPPGEAAGVVVRPGDICRAHNAHVGARRPERLQRFLLAQRLQPTIGVAAHHFGRRVVEYDQRGVLGHPGGPAGVIHRDGGDLHVAPASAVEGLGQRAHLTGHVGRGVDGDVQLPEANADRSTLRSPRRCSAQANRSGLVSPPVEQRHRVVVGDQRADDVASDELRTTG